jgi:hypothetical protein
MAMLDYYIRKGEKQAAIPDDDSVDVDEQLKAQLKKVEFDLLRVRIICQMCKDQQPLAVHKLARWRNRRTNLEEMAKVLTRMGKCGEDVSDLPGPWGVSKLTPSPDAFPF